MYLSLCISLGRRPARAPPPSPPPPRVGSGPREPAFLHFFYGATNKDSLAARSESPRALRIRSSRRALPTARARDSAWGRVTARAARRRGRVTGLGPHERRLRRGLQPREERNGFKGPQQTNPCYPAGPPRHATSQACLLGLAPPGGR